MIANENRGGVKPVVTVGVCVKDSALTLGAAIDSIMSQDYPHELIEVVFVDDGSTDETLSIISKQASQMDMMVKVFHHAWRGLGPSRNVVVENASGDFILWVDGDMILPVDHIRTSVKFMLSNPDVGIAKAKYGLQDEGNLVAFLENANYVAVDCIYGGKPTNRALGTGGAIYRVDSIRQVGGFDNSIKGVGEDMDAEIRIRKAGWLLFLGSPAFFYERRRASLQSLWKEGFWHGYGGNVIFRKNRDAFALVKMTPPAGFVGGAWYAVNVYDCVRRKSVFLLPFQTAFKRIAWCLGFVKAQIDNRRIMHGV